MQKEISNIFNYLNKEKINYCQWKSTANLNKSFDGKTDFDLLIDRKDSDKLILLLIQKGFKRRQSTYNKTYHSMEDYIGFDEITGKLIHFHLHYTLIMGKRFKKNYSLPLEKLILETAIIDKKFSIRIIKPEIEIILLIIRALIKTKINRSLILMMIMQRNYLPQNITDEINYLMQIVDLVEVRKNCKLYFQGFNDYLELLISCPINEINLLQFFKIKKKVEIELSKFNRFNKKKVNLDLHIRQLSAKNSRSYINTGGLSIAFIGADGSGKSTISKDIAKWLSWKLSIKRIYMGIPQKHRLYIIIGYLVNITYKLNLQKMEQYFQNLRWLFISNYRKKKYEQSIRFKNQGYIVILDRYPLTYFNQMEKPMDGARINSNYRLSKKENMNYKVISEPDEIICMRVTFEQSVNRKVEHKNHFTQNLLKKKIEAIESFILANKKSGIKIINSDKDIKAKTLEIKKIIWNII